MRKVKLTQGLFSLVSDRDYKRVSKFKWFAQRIGKRIYAARRFYHSNGGSSYVYMHRFILKVRKGVHVDHRKDRLGLDNRRSNLRTCNRFQNSGNVPVRKHTSKYKGVYFNGLLNTWDARISIKGKNTRLGQFKSEAKAGLSYNRAAKKVFGKFAWLNKI